MNFDLPNQEPDEIFQKRKEKAEKLCQKEQSQIDELF